MRGTGALRLPWLRAAPFEEGRPFHFPECRDVLGPSRLWVVSLAVQVVDRLGDLNCRVSSVPYGVEPVNSL